MCVGGALGSRLRRIVALVYSFVRHGNAVWSCAWTEDGSGAPTCQNSRGNNKKQSSSSRRAQNQIKGAIDLYTINIL